MSSALLSKAHRLRERLSAVTSLLGYSFAVEEIEH